jgi:hypothetical protein
MSLSLIVMAGVSSRPGSLIPTLIGTSARAVVHHEPQIQEYAVAEPQLPVIPAVQDAGSRLTVGPLDGSQPTRTLAERTDVSQHQASGWGGSGSSTAPPP